MCGNYSASSNTSPFERSPSRFAKGIILFPHYSYIDITKLITWVEISEHMECSVSWRKTQLTSLFLNQCTLGIKSMSPLRPWLASLKNKNRKYPFCNNYSALSGATQSQKFLPLFARQLFNWLEVSLVTNWNAGSTRSDSRQEKDKRKNAWQGPMRTQVLFACGFCSAFTTFQ